MAAALGTGSFARSDLRLVCSQAFAEAQKRVKEASEGAAEAEARRRAMQAELRELAATLEVRVVVLAVLLLCSACGLVCAIFAVLDVTKFLQASSMTHVL